MSERRLAGPLSDHDLERALKGALLMDDPGRVPNELRAAVAGIPDEPAMAGTGRRRRFRGGRRVAAAAAAVVLVAATLGLGLTLRGGVVGQVATPSTTAQTARVSPTVSPTAAPSPAAEETASPTPAPYVPPGYPSSPGAAGGWTGLDWSSAGGIKDAWGVSDLVAWKGGFLALGARKSLDGPAFWASTNGTDWTPVAVPADGGGLAQAHIAGLAATSDRLLAYGTDSTGSSCPAGAMACVIAAPGAIWSSRDGTTWTKVAALGPASITAITSGPNGLVAVGNAETYDAWMHKGDPLVWISQTGDTWEAVDLDPTTFPATALLGTTRWTGSGYVIGGTAPDMKYGSGHTALWWSADGRAWEAAEVPGESDAVGGITGFNVGKNGILATGTELRAWWSSDGRRWEFILNHHPPSNVVYDDGSRMVAFVSGASIEAWGSVDGKTWEALPLTKSLPDTTPLPFPGEYGWHPNAIVLSDSIVVVDVGVTDDSSSTVRSWRLTAN